MPDSLGIFYGVKNRAQLLADRQAGPLVVEKNDL